MLGRIRSEANPRSIESAERILGQLKTQLDYAQADDIVAAGIPSYLQKIQDAAAEAARAVQSAYFLH